MPRQPLYRSDVLPYHVTARANNREAFPLELSRMWSVFVRECSVLSIVHQVEIHAFVMMPNHFHLILTVPLSDLGAVMSVFLSSVTRTSNLYSGRSGHLFGGPYYRSIIQSTRYYGHALKYVYRNPVRANLCARVEGYEFSTLHGLLGHSHLGFPIHQTRVGMEVALPEDSGDHYLDWLNRPFPNEAENLIRKGLRKSAFGLQKDRSTRKPIEALESLI